MADDAPRVSCPFLRELFALLTTELPASPLGVQDQLFQLLLDLERRAQSKGAEPRSLAAIAAARKTAGAAASTIWPPRDRWH
ncbi:hypothetical protein [Methylorubrum extorquens]|uniref:hypothetical protein n=1 Tax=Methylorubrum extorquens TaxID=408 RepID=UPI0005A6C88F|nr:hypothetical protein [Methylorubrum extorquens]KQP87568.1 hypothetical protein ASF55_07010 [Methylobacterium sp. Leaf119]WIU37501.1 hypothetical protein KQ926_12745 [Methylorubrum extorquens]